MIKDRGAKRAAEMAAPLAPIETGPAQRPAALQRADVDAGTFEEFCAVARDANLVAAAGQ
jgi:hypothetical protein